MLSQICFVMLAAMAAADSTDSSVSLRGLPPPPTGQTGLLGFEIRVPWMDGCIEMRFPETLNSSQGLHFIDHSRPDMPPLSLLDPYPVWHQNPQTGAVSYAAKTKEGVEFSGVALPDGETVRMEFRVKNGTGKPMSKVSSQMCLVLNKAPVFAKTLDLAPCYTWLKGKFTSLAETTPTPQEKGRKPWILLLTNGFAAQYKGLREWPDGWWVVDQTADRNLIARVSEDKKHLVAIAWDETDSQLMTNTMIPCLHAGPIRSASIRPDEEAVWLGSIYLMRNDPELLLSHHELDVKGGFKVMK